MENTKKILHKPSVSRRATSKREVDVREKLLSPDEAKARSVAWKALQDYFKPYHWKPGEKMLSEELLEDRRAEAMREGY